MDVDNLKEVDEVAHALAAAKALGKDQVTKSSADLQDISDILRELNMDHYDDEDEGAFSSPTFLFKLYIEKPLDVLENPIDNPLIYQKILPTYGIGQGANLLQSRGYLQALIIYGDGL